MAICRLITIFVPGLHNILRIERYDKLHAITIMCF